MAHMSAKHVIEKCGGFEAVSEMTGASLGRVYCWTYPRERGGTDNQIPTRHQPNLLKQAQERGIDLKPADFFFEESA